MNAAAALFARKPGAYFRSRRKCGDVRRLEPPRFRYLAGKTVSQRLRHEGGKATGRNEKTAHGR
jgi:hypothetical protein